MRRLISILLTAATVLSAIFLVTICILWARSYHLSDQLVWRRLDGATSIRSAQGSVVLTVHASSWTGYPADYYGLKYTRDLPRSSIDDRVGMMLLNVNQGDTFFIRNWGGFSWDLWQGRGRGSLITTLVAPFWSLAAATSILPLAWPIRRWRVRARARRRQSLNLCPACGYDCRATPDQCPECGAKRSPSTLHP
jgi:hypothetical protein